MSRELIRRIVDGEPGALEGLGRLLQETVHAGASVGFLAPLSDDRARAYWEGVFAQLGEGLLLWVAEEDGEIVGSVQLALCPKENGRHRADLQKMIVLPSRRRRGIASALLEAAEAGAREHGRTLLVLDTVSGSGAEFLYRRHGWQFVGPIPEYAADPQGNLEATSYFYKRLPPPPG